MEENKITKWASYIFQGLIAVMFLMSAAMNISGNETAISMATDMGYEGSAVLYFGLTQVLCIALYLYPRTSILGAIIITGWLGGAVATHAIHGDPLGQTLFPIIIGVFVWLVLWLRSGVLRKILAI